MKSFLQRQSKSREYLTAAVRHYVALRSGTGEYTDTVRTNNRDGIPVVVFVRLDIVPVEQ